VAYDFDVTNPLDTSYISDYPANERDQRLAVKGAFEVDHELDAGAHDKVTLDESEWAAATPDPAAGYMAVYCKDSGGQPELFAQEEDDGAPGDTIQITKAGYLADVISLAAGSPDANRTMLDHLIIATTKHIQLANASFIQGRDVGDADYLDLLQLDASDYLNVGDVASGSIQKIILKLADDAAGTPAENLLFNYGAGDKKIWHEGLMGTGSGLDADLLDGGDMATYSALLTGYQKFPNTFILNWGRTNCATGIPRIFV
jgi:hypothetical protein